MNWTSEFIILGACILLSAYFSGFETGTYTLNRLRLRYRTEKGESPARILTGLLSRLETLVCTILLGNNVVAYVAALVVTGMYEAWLHHPVRSEIATTLTLTPVLFVFAEVVPKEVFRSRADTLVYLAARSMRVFTWIFAPFTVALRGLIHLFGRVIGEEGKVHTLEVTPARLRYTFAQGAEAGILTPYQDEMARNIIGLREVRVRDVFIPLKKVTLANNAVDHDRFLELAKRSRFSRIPIWQGRKTNIIGVVHVFDFLAEDRPGLTIRNYVREVPRIAPEASVYQALLTLQTSRTPLGIVAKDGRALGVVTVKDLIEEIVGELET